MLCSSESTPRLEAYARCCQVSESTNRCGIVANQLQLDGLRGSPEGRPNHVMAALPHLVRPPRQIRSYADLQRFLRFVVFASGQFPRWQRRFDSTPKN